MPTENGSPWRRPGSTTPTEGLEHFQTVARTTIERCERTLKRIEEGLDLLESDPQVADAFRFMNHAMWLQRTRSLFSEGVRRGRDIDYNDVDIPRNRSWYPFQLAFILLNLPGIARLEHPDRSESPDAVADLLWFPTGGGKTEAYLGLTAFTLAIRRLQGTIEGRSGEDGVAVLMRYTLRLLTLQQFQRATALICACEVIRRQAEAQERSPLGPNALPHRPLGGFGLDPQPHCPERRGAQDRHRQHGQEAAGCGGRRWFAPPTDQLPLVRLEDRLHPPLLPHRDRQQGAGPHLRLLRRQVRPVRLQPEAVARRGHPDPGGR